MRSLVWGSRSMTRTILIEALFASLTFILASLLLAIKDADGKTGWALLTTVCEQLRTGKIDSNE